MAPWDTYTYVLLAFQEGKQPSQTKEKGPGIGARPETNVLEMASKFGYWLVKFATIVRANCGATSGPTEVINNPSCSTAAPV